jgi:hypothetical protein
MKAPKGFSAWMRKIGGEGGKARAKALTPARRSEIARIAVAAREAKRKKV